MIRIVLIAPYESLKPLIETVLAEYNAPEPIRAIIHVMPIDQIEGVTINGDVVIARGLSYDAIKRKFPEMLSVPMRISGYDIIQAVHTAVRRYHPKRIALLGSRSMLYSSEKLNGIFNGLEIRTYQAENAAQLSQGLCQAQQENCDCFIGGLSLVQMCEHKLPSVLIETGKSAIDTSMDEAVRLVTTYRAEQERSAQYKTMIDHSKDGIVSINKSGVVLSVNRVAQKYLNLDAESCIGKQIKSYLPFTEKPLAEILSSGKKLENEVCRFAGRLLTIDYIPTIQCQQVGGAILFVRSVNRLQEDESLIRKKMTGQFQKAKYHFEDIIYRSKEFTATVETARIYAAVDSPVLIVGESGTGKELIAQSIHNASPRRDGPFIAINCAALSESLLESELFGYSDGAFTGALKGGKEGLFEAAHGGTIFLDEISEIPISFQSKLLRVLQEGEVRRIGVAKVVSIDVRVIAATNRDLRTRVREGMFRQDLLFRLNVLNLFIPPLRNRKEDIIDLFYFYIKEYAARYHKNISVITGDAKELLENFSWEGNVRELKNIAERICVLNPEERIGGALVERVLSDEKMQQLETWDATCPEEDSLNEKDLILSLMKRYNGNKSRIAEHLGMNRSTLWRKLKKMEIE